MALNSLLCADVPLSNYSLTHSEKRRRTTEKNDKRWPHSDSVWHKCQTSSKRRTSERTDGQRDASPFVRPPVRPFVRSFFWTTLHVSPCLPASTEISRRRGPEGSGRFVKQNDRNAGEPSGNWCLAPSKILQSGAILAYLNSLNVFKSRLKNILIS